MRSGVASGQNTPYATYDPDLNLSLPRRFRSGDAALVCGPRTRAFRTGP
jgi:hypothetical protein